MQLVCFSHLPWNFVYQRPQHLLSRFAHVYSVYYIEEFNFSGKEDGFDIERTKDNVLVIRPFINGNDPETHLFRQRSVITDIIRQLNIQDFIAWYYTPMAYLFSNHLTPSVIVYDCMDELSAFKFADDNLKNAEQLLLHNADIVFTGGRSLYEAREHDHANIHLFASSIDKKHFEKARHQSNDADEQQNIPHPRLGYFGVIDERFDIDLINKVAEQKPGWHFILIGPVVKIDAAELPRKENIHYLGMKNYSDLPAYIAGWDIALIPFALNESTRFISPTKTLEYLAAGKPVISTAIRDVVTPYGDAGLVSIVQDAETFIAAAEKELNNTNKEEWLDKVDELLANNSWDMTWSNMHSLVKNEMMAKQLINQ